MNAKWLFVLAACGGSSTTGTTTPTTHNSPAESAAAEPTSGAATGAPAGTNVDAPEISRSQGAADGVVVLWPRIPGHAKDDQARQIAGQIQQRLKAIIERARPGKPIDVRPEPERACGRAGCTAIAVGAVLVVNDGGCAVAATVTASGASPTRVVPWAAEMDLKAETVPFREAPEQLIGVKDYVRCTEIAASLPAGEAKVEAAIRAP